MKIAKIIIFKVEYWNVIEVTGALNFFVCTYKIHQTTENGKVSKPFNALTIRGVVFRQFQTKL